MFDRGPNMPDLLDPTPANIRALRLKAGFTQRQCAEFCMVALGTWTGWERGRRKMPQLAWYTFKQRAEDRILELKL